MTQSSTPVRLDERRRAHRLLYFVADLLGGGEIEDVADLATPLPTVKHLARLQMDLAVTRDAAPSHMRAILAYARRRQKGFLLTRFRDPAPGILEALFDVVLFDTGLAVLDQLSLATFDGRRFWLAGRDLHLRIIKDGLVPTLTDPWDREDDRDSFISKGDRVLAEYVWRD